ncbi:oligopeptide-binding protein OppA [[Clostridium] sordellii]|uniref:Bacterial extracellular solute-binding s, 5Middle family protein n=1 Tax=Paraclostridium sordellii TaxID=1505 RepID=A0ABM9RLR2_PARSO|nr:ABC transporter substrate-binding protein [Paeniclostridium sordellii]CEJ72938.1 bacterial extracellular solute-binding s, 5Middle family protein [[Clostridium] sordellii] [Paeniclostridium sordellii]CEN68491.1 oligopeptide-binding protein OppA [[Clostridium] sordellii] [Paeniclostridium sordellii]CEN71758.1 oligopeptide-binding protein OppA [[Clostridium] sordellii] [Paeniclostridium sordellii]CEO22283.1 oligopeptide-binding protein OppA [[Clostridium] sordellii] [Paeniclostridium sordellii
MVLRKKLALLFALSSSGILALTGCSNTGSSGGNSGSSKSADPYAVLANENARKAIVMSIDTPQISDVILNNGSKSVSFVTPESLAFTKEGKDYREVAGDMGYKPNDEEAKKAWEKAKEELGFDNVTIELLSYEGEAGRKTAEFIQSELNSNLEGINVEIKQQPLKQKLELATKGDYHIDLNGWSADYPDPLTFLDIFTSQGMYAQRLSYSNTEYDKLIEEAKNAETPEESFKKYGEAEKLFLDEAYAAPLYQTGSSLLQKDYVKDIVRYTYGSPASYKWADVDKANKELNLTLAGDIPTLDVSKASDMDSFYMITNTMEGLTRVDAKGVATPAMAESWEQSEDGKTWTFKIRKDAKWSNGDPVTAKDFEYSWKRTLNPETASQYGYVMYDIEGASDYNNGKVDNADNVGVKALDDNTLQVKLNRRVNYFDQLMSFCVFFPQNQKFVEAQPDKIGTTAENTVYNGPFTMSTWKMDDLCVLSKNDNYWDKDTVKLNKVNLKVVKDPNAAINLYETGGIDVVGLTSENVDKYKDSKEFMTTKKAETYFLLLNNKGNK